MVGFGRFSAALSCVLVACTVDLAAPAPSSVEPARGYNGEETAITVIGERFYPQIEVDSTAGGRTEINPGFAVRLERGAVTSHLGGVSLEDYEHVRALVPEGLEPGLYDLVVVGPSGQEGRLDDAFTVTDTRADRLEVDSESVVYEVFETAFLDVSLVDPEGLPVLADLEVVVIVKNDDGAVAAQFLPGGLEDQQPFGTGFGILGRLGEDGAARIGLTLGTPDTVDVLVSPGPDSSQIGEATLKIRFDAGSELNAEITLPEAPLVVTAGETFPITVRLVDQFGNAVPGASELVVLKDLCDSWVDAVVVEESAVVEVTLGEATGTVGCPVDRIVSLAGPPGASDDILVLPGAVARFEVLTSPAVVVAGEPDLDAVITPVDEFGNRTEWTPSALTITDTVGGVLSAQCGGGIPVFCTVSSVVASSMVRLRVVDEAGIAGESALYAVRPGAPAALDVAVTGPAVAGEPLPVALRTLDAWGNLVSGAFPPSEVAWTSAGDAPHCAPASTDADGTMRFSCALFAARADAVLDATTSQPALVGASDAFVVVNGALGDVVITPGATTVTAGVPLTLSFAAFDAWGNPWVVKDDPVVQIADEGGSLSLAQVTLDAQGEATAQGSFTRAGVTEVTALRDLAEVGRSAPITVDAAGADAIAVDVGVPWVWVGDEVPVAVEVVDTFGNTAAYTGTVTLTAASDQAPPVPVAVSGGAGVGLLVWSAPDLSETIDALDGGLTGTSTAFVVVEACAGGPVADVSFGGFDDALVCLTNGEGTLVASLAGSTPGMTLYGVRAGDAWTTSSSSSLSVPLHGAGRYDVEALVARADGCADAVAADAWAGPDDGDPVGPIGVTLVDPVLSVGQESTDVLLEATDCTRDPAAGATVRVRVDRGAVTGAPATGSGLGVVLDGTGDGAAVLDAVSAHTGGPAVVSAWAPLGAAFGEAQSTFLGDDRKPAVWALDPAGDTTGLVDTVVLDFSEALNPAQVVPGSFSVTGPSTVTVSAAVLGGSGRRVTLTLDPPADADAGTWTVTASQVLRDAAQGNRLDGAGTGLPSDFVGRFGDLPAAVSPVSACAPTPTVFRPDGDDGAGVESDDVSFALDSNTAPFRWVATVHGSAGSVHRLERLVPAGPTDVWVWDGRDATGRILPVGAYVVTVDAVDADGNRGGACTAVATIQQHAGGAP